MRKYALLAALVLTGCTTSPQDCDLHAQDPSFITKLSCATSGGYRQPVDQKEQQVRLSQYQNESAQTLAKLKSSKIQSRERQQEIAKLQELQRQSQTATSASEISAIEKKVAEAKHKIKVLEEANTLR